MQRSTSDSPTLPATRAVSPVKAAGETQGSLRQNPLAVIGAGALFSLRAERLFSALT